MNAQAIMHDYAIHRNTIAKGYDRIRKVSHGANIAAAVILGAQASDYVAASLTHSLFELNPVVFSLAFSALCLRGYTAALESRFNPSRFPERLPLETTQAF